MFCNAKNPIRTYLDPKAASSLAGWLATIATILGLTLSTGVTAFAGSPVKDQPPTAKFPKIPLRFEANQGQTDSQVKFLSRGDGYSLFLTSNAAVLRTPDGANGGPAVIRMELLQAHRAVQVTGSDKVPGVVNYFIGNDPKSSPEAYPVAIAQSCWHAIR
jgi:hypothetical protein